MLKGNNCLVRTGVAVLVKIFPLVPWLMEEVDSLAMCPSNSVYLLTLCMDLSNEGLNIQVINVIINSLTEYMRQSVQVRRGKRQVFFKLLVKNLENLLLKHR